MNRSVLLVVLGLLLAAVVLLPSGAAEDDPRRRTGDSGIVMVTAEWCGYCRSQEQLLRAAGVPYEAVDFDTSAGQRAMRALGARGVPVTVVGQRVLRGYDVDRLRDNLSPLGYRIP
jgi:glutaredoxin